jgi:regulatory protein
MEKEESFKKALSSAYAFVARRPHGTKELEVKLLDKGFESDLVDKVIQELLEKGFLNDYDVAYRWAESRIKNRLWGRTKLYHFLREKNIKKDIIDRVQQGVWGQFSEEDTARKAVNKRFPSVFQPSQSKILSFLKSRGFSSGVIYGIVKDVHPDDQG